MTSMALRLLGTWLHIILFPTKQPEPCPCNLHCSVSWRETREVPGSPASALSLCFSSDAGESGAQGCGCCGRWLAPAEIPKPVSRPCPDASAALGTESVPADTCDPPHPSLPLSRSSPSLARPSAVPPIQPWQRPGERSPGTRPRAQLGTLHQMTFGP